MPDRRCHIVLNSQAGTAASMGLTPEALQRRFEEQGWEATVHPDAAASLSLQIEHALASEAPILAAAGGDGTVSALARALVDSGKTLLVLPLGTANLLARDLGMPLDLDEAIAALPDMRPQRIDVGEVNGRRFLHNVTIGFAPGLAARREQLRGQADLAAMIGFLRLLLHRLSQPRRMAVEIAPRNGAPHIERVRSVTIANNDYDEGLGRLFARDRLDAGQLTLYLVRRLALADLLRLIVRMSIGRWHDDRVLKIESAEAVTIRLRRRSVLTTVDGEVETLSVPLRFRILPLALSVLAPVPDDGESQGAAAELALGA